MLVYSIDDDMLNIFSAAVKLGKFTAAEINEKIGGTLSKVESQVNILNQVGFFTMVSIDPDYTYKIHRDHKNKINKIIGGI